jgi:hypothetical protein
LLLALTTAYPTAQQQHIDFVVKEQPFSAKERLRETVSQLLTQYSGEVTPDSVGEFLGVTSDQAQLWLDLTGQRATRGGSEA